jgi:hypothetical protein
MLRRARGFVSLWDILTVLAGAVAFGNSWTAVTYFGVLGANRVWALIVGVLVAVGCIWLVRSMGNGLFRLIDKRFSVQDDDSKRKLERALRGVYFGAFLWLIASGVLGFQATKLFINCCLA